MPPADTVAKMSTKSSAIVMMIPWIKSVIDAARNPPAAVYPTITIAETIIAPM